MTRNSFDAFLKFPIHFISLITLLYASRRAGVEFTSIPFATYSVLSSSSTKLAALVGVALTSSERVSENLSLSFLVS